jgi:hypothetical protein
MVTYLPSRSLRASIDTTAALGADNAVCHDANELGKLVGKDRLLREDACAQNIRPGYSHVY